MGLNDVPAIIDVIGINGTDHSHVARFDPKTGALVAPSAMLICAGNKCYHPAELPFDEYKALFPNGPVYRATDK